MFYINNFLHFIRPESAKIFSLMWVVVTLFTPASSSAQEEKPQTLPNIILIMVDDMGYGDPQCYNPDSKIPTPHIDSLAAGGMRFTDAHSAGALCHPSRYGLLTGQYPFRANPGAWRTKATIAPDRMTIASLLKSADYHTAMVGKWHLGFDEKTYRDPLPGGPVDRGFDSFFGIRASTDIPPYFYIRDNMAVMPPDLTIEANNSEGWSPIQGAFWREGGISPDLKLELVLPKFTSEAVNVIQKHKKNFENGRNPLFLYLAYPAPHTPWLPSQEFIGKSGAGMYGDFMTMVDANIGHVLKALREADMEDNSLIIFTSDNGPVWYDEDVERLGHDSAGGLRGMKSDAWEAGHRMPFIVQWPGVVEAGSVCAETIGFVDVLATLADVSGQKLPPDAGPDSISFMPLLKKEFKGDGPFRSPLVVESGGGLMTIRSGPWKLIQGLGSGGFSTPRRIQPTPDGPQVQLYNLDLDPAELENHSLSHPDIVEALQHELETITSASSSR